MLLIDSDPSRREILNAIGRLGDEAYQMLRRACRDLNLDVSSAPPFRVSAILSDLRQLHAAATAGASHHRIRKPRKPRKNNGPLMQEMTND